MRKIIVLAASFLLTGSVCAADQKAKIAVAKVEAKAIVSPSADEPAPRPVKVKTSESPYGYSLERDGCCYTR